ncbi:hypothetical protein HYALB_00009304 [Hymenoscyphus albidus]|uniref:Uncharacterized protein n=1 Tax=Hymenoscyphus albidus TaxID=595503 RepID=A0A9N9LCF1_9HELO|nr:hypothetical protein HYALB_00009304 [Hymenoscyphus albidus]
MGKNKFFTPATPTFASLTANSIHDQLTTGPSATGLSTTGPLALGPSTTGPLALGPSTTGPLASGTLYHAPNPPNQAGLWYIKNVLVHLQLYPANDDNPKENVLLNNHTTNNTPDVLIKQDPDLHAHLPPGTNIFAPGTNFPVPDTNSIAPDTNVLPTKPKAAEVISGKRALSDHLSPLSKKPKQHIPESVRSTRGDKNIQIIELLDDSDDSIKALEGENMNYLNRIRSQLNFSGTLSPAKLA